MEYVIIILVALSGAFLSFFSGFGLGTLLLPAFMLVFPPHVAIAASAVVHLLNNVFKLFLVAKHAHRKTVISFGLFSITGAVAGALMLNVVLRISPLHTYSLGMHTFDITWTKITIALLILVFSIMEFSPRRTPTTISARWLPAGGLLSGFFGGLSGHQGALRSAFLMNAGLSKESFMGTRVVVACLVDVTRITVYTAQIGDGWQGISPVILSSATLAAFAGAYFGNRYMKITSMEWIRKFVAVSLVLFAAALGAGLI